MIKAESLRQNQHAKCIYGNCSVSCSMLASCHENNLSKVIALLLHCNAFSTPDNDQLCSCSYSLM